MKMIMITRSILLALSTVAASGASEHFICKNVQNLFREGADVRIENHTGMFQGPPGKRGIPGARGEPGFRGMQGPPGIPAVVDYEKISKTVEDTIFKALRCKDQNGLWCEEKCYIVPPIPSSRDLNYNQAIQKCNSLGALLAEIHSLAHQQAVQDFLRSRIPSSPNLIELWVGMNYQSSGGNLRLRSGNKVSASQFKWYHNHPQGSDDKIAIAIRNDGNESFEGLFNYRENASNMQGVICEKNL